MRPHRGIAGAQNNLGRLYADGLGVPKDNVKVLMWYNVALPGLRGEEASNALTFRDDFAAGMPRQQVAQAEALATRCRESGFKACE